MVHRKQQPEPLHYQRNFRVRLAGKGHLLIATTRLVVAVHHFSDAHREPDYTIRFTVEDNPELQSILHPVQGWDFIGLIGFLWRKIDVLNTLDLRDEALRRELGLRTVSGLSQTKKRQEKRPVEQAMKMIREYVLDHPSCTRLEISRHLGRAKAPYVIAQIEWMVLQGTLARASVDIPGGRFEWRYIVVDDNGD